MNKDASIELSELSRNHSTHNKSLEERIAVLEERARPKPRSFTDYIKEWAGVGTLMIALLYTFSLGVWDRFFVTAEQRRAAQTDQLRNLAIALSDLDAELARSYFSISDEQVRAFFSRAMSSKKAALIEREIMNLKENYDELSAAEMILLAYNVGLSGKMALADEIYEMALRKADSDDNVAFRSDIFRLRAQLHSSGPNGVDIRKARENYARAIAAIAEYAAPNFKLQVSNSAFEWAVLELASQGGDWRCGQSLGAWAIKIVEGLPHINPEIATYELTVSQSAGAVRETARSKRGGL